MKKTDKLFLPPVLFAASITLLTFFVSCPGNGPNGVSDGHQEWQEDIFNKMFKANSRESVFEKHKNFQIVTTTAEAGIEHGMINNTRLVEKDFIYTEEDYSDLLNKGEPLFYDTYYSSTSDYICKRGETYSKFLLSCYAMTKEEKDAFLFDSSTVAPMKDERDSGEKLVSAVDNEDGIITVITSLPIEKAEDFKTGVPGKWKDTRIEYDSFLDAETFEVKNFCAYVVTMAGRIKLYSGTFSYDVEESDRLKSIKAFAEKIEKNTFTPTNKLTVYYNYGMKNEEKYEFQRDASFYFFLSHRDGYEAFKDEKGTELIENPGEYNADDVAEVTLYMFKKASDEPVLDKFYIDVTMANSSDGIFSRHDNASIVTKFGPGAELVNKTFGKELVLLTDYFDKDYIFYRVGNSSSTDAEDSSFSDLLYTDKGTYVHEIFDGKEEWHANWYILNDDERPFYLQDGTAYYSILEDGRSIGEIILSAEENDDGTCTMVSVLPVKIHPKLFGYQFPKEWDDGSYEFITILEKETLEVKKITTTIISNDKRYLLHEKTYNYDVPKPERLDAIQEFAEKVEDQENINATKTFTAIYDYGTDHEETFVFKRDATFTIGILFRRGYKPCKDAEGTELYEAPIDASKEDTEDTTIYLIKKN